MPTWPRRRAITVRRHSRRRCAKLDRDVRWIVVHRKARFAAEIARELEALRLPNVELVKPGVAYEF